MSGLQHEVEVEVSFCPFLKFVNFAFWQPAKAAVGGGELNPFAVFCLVFENVAHHEVGNGFVASRLGHEACAVGVHNVALSRTPVFHLRLCFAEERRFWHIRDIVVGRLHAIPVGSAVEHSHRLSHDALSGHFASVLAFAAHTCHREFHQSPLLAFGHGIVKHIHLVLHIGETVVGKFFADGVFLLLKSHGAGHSHLLASGGGFHIKDGCTLIGSDTALEFAQYVGSICRHGADADGRHQHNA